MQLVVGSNGMILDASFPISCRHNDIFNEQYTEIDKRMGELVIDGNLNNSLALYGDDAYSGNHRYILSRLVNPEEDHWKQLFNTTMSALRVSIEHENGILKSRFAFLNYKCGLRLRQMKVHRILTASVILSNCYNCLIANQISEYFDIRPPTLHQYLNELENTNEIEFDNNF